MNPIRLLIVDDHPLMREAVHLAADEEPDMRIIGEAADGVEGIRLALEQHPDVFIMDLLMPGLDGVAAIAQIRAADPQARILVITSLNDEERILAAIQAGALGYFSKSSPRATLLEAIRQVAEGRPYLPPEITLKLMNGWRKPQTAPLFRPSAEPLTFRQKEILALLAEGRSDADISRILHLEESTIRSHVAHMLQRLGLDTRAQLVAYVNQQLKNE